MTYDDLSEAVHLHCGAFLDYPGEVYFGSRQALSRCNGLAIVGLNPGGENGPTMRERLSRYATEPSRDRFSGYLDQCWHEPKYSEGDECEACNTSLHQYGHVRLVRHQKTVVRISDELEIDLRQALAFNAIWLQTQNASKLRKFLREQHPPQSLTSHFQQLSLPVFQEVFDRCNVRLVLCLGNGVSDSAFSLFRKALGVPAEAVTQVGQSYRDGRYFDSVSGGHRRTYFGIAHPSLHETTSAGLNELKAQWDGRRASTMSLVSAATPQAK